MMNHPFVIFGISLFLLWLSTRAGIFLRTKRRHIPEEGRDDLVMVMSAALTLLGLLIGFSFSMAISRYDLRKSYEEAEANAIGTEYVRADLLPAASASKLRPLLTKYLDQRILFYTTGEKSQASSVNANTSRIESELWSTVSAAAAEQKTPMVALAVSGMNDVLNSQGYTQAAWWNRIPAAAWVLMFAIAICCSLLVGVNMRRGENEPVLLLVLPLIISIAFFLIAEIDSPGGGIVRIGPQNLVSLSESLQAN